MMNDEPTQDNLPRPEPAGDRAQAYSPLARGERELPRPVPYPEPDPGDRPPRRVRRRKRRSPFWSTVRTGVKFGCIGLAMILAALLGAGLIAGVVMYNSLAAELAEDLERLDSMEGVEDFETTRIYDRSGEVLLYEVFDEGRRTEVTLDRIPIKLRYATIATEDDTFYENPGFDPPSIMRAAWQWYQEGEIVSGASTITQQLVDQIVFSYEERTAQSMRVKLKEVALAWVMTQKYTKDEILELYLNEIYYGNLAYGIEEAANVYFDKPATELTLGEAAFLAGLPQSPGTYDPYNNFGMAKARQRQVLDLMVRHGYISMDEADSAFNERPVAVSDLADPAIALEAPHFTVEARRRLAELPGIEPEMIERGGLVVTTTIDMDLQAAAERIAAEHIAEHGAEYNMSNAAIVALNPNNGEVLAMVGSVDYENEAIDGQVNNTLSLHQPGSSIKPLTYAVALEQGWTPADILWDVPMEYSTGVGAYQPVNYDGRFHGPVRLRDALANSYNIPAVELLNRVGVANLLEMSNRLGINSLENDPARYGLSLTLGGGEVTPVEMASAFGAFANGGHRVTPQMILRVEDNRGSVLYEAPAGPGEQVLDERIAFVISSMLSDNAARTPAMGSESPLLVDFPAAAKTGTTNDYRDNWTVGYTPHLVVAVWAGNTDDTPMAEGTSGLTGAAPIWHDTMTAFYNMPGIEQKLGGASLPLRADFTPPPGVESRQVCVLSSLADPAPAEGGCPRQRAEWFLVGGLDPSIPPTQVPTPTPVPTLAPQPGDPDAPDVPEG
ncbi:MAG TPA: PBP1A family penicillin-binding protein, partial [Aggregatilineales bacterium]|nr:PBP1A family penicillin-binding protein [Aggregatilineales bacterium]